MAPLPPPQPGAPLRPPRRRERDAASANDVLGTDHGREDGPDVEAKKWRPPRDGILRGPPLSQPLPDESLGVELLEAMKQHGARPALVSAGLRVSHPRSDQILLLRERRSLVIESLCAPCD